jgi:hypothetical protein
MRKFSIILPQEVIEQPRFLWWVRDGEILRLFSRLIGVRVIESDIMAVYQPAFSVQSTDEATFFEIHFTRWQSLILYYDDFGPDLRWFDLRDD